MKFFILAALVAVAAAYPVEESVREKRGVLAYAAPGLVLPSPIYGRALVAPALVAPGLVAPGLAAPAVVDPASGTTVVGPTPISGGAVLSPQADVVGPSPLGTVGTVATRSGLLYI